VLRKILFTLLSIVLALLACGAIYVSSRQNLKFDPPYPPVTASTDSAVIARGKYVVRSVANCYQCHGDTTLRARAMAGEEVPLSGGNTWDIPPGRFHARNITSDDETGIGKFTDGAIARALREGVGHDGRALLPFMELQGLSDEDLVAVVSYLRSQPPVHNLVPAHEYSFLGKIIKATVLSQPVGPSAPPPKVSPRGATIENGKYLVESVALCWACHTQRDTKTGQLVGPRFGGATDFKEDSDPGHVWAPPNITADPATGRLGHMSADEFVNRFHGGRLIEGSPMPWQGFQRMSEDDLRAMYLYLTSLPPVSRDVGPPVRDAAPPRR
jgi:mono/diheme cytochrome c family protein